MATGIVSLAIVSAIIVIPLLLFSPGGFWHSFFYHAQRGLQIESTYASFLELAYAFGLIKLDFVFSFGSVNLVSPLADILARISFAVMFVSLFVTYWFFFKGMKNVSGINPVPRISGHTGGWLVNYSIVSILIFILTSKVFSPQYIIWLFPLIPLITGKWRGLSILLFIMAGLMTFFVYPKYYAGIEHGELVTVGMLVLRNAALIMLVFVTAKSLSPRPVPITPRS
jgi:hypothetical protein